MRPRSAAERSSSAGRRRVRKLSRWTVSSAPWRRPISSLPILRGRCASRVCSAGRIRVCPSRPPRSSWRAPVLMPVPSARRPRNTSCRPTPPSVSSGVPIRKSPPWPVAGPPGLSANWREPMWWGRCRNAIPCRPSARSSTWIMRGSKPLWASPSATRPSRTS